MTFATVDYKYGFINPLPGISRPLRPDYDTFHARLRPHHYGIDAYAAEGSEVRASAAGTIRTVQDKNIGLAGAYIEILHPTPNAGWFLTRYLHLLAGSIKVEKGEKVRIMQRLARCDTTGNANSPHLHFDIRYDPNGNAHISTQHGSRWGIPYDPIRFGILQIVPDPTLVGIKVDRPILRRGDEGQAVKELQFLLTLRQHSLTPDGDFGPKSERAVRTYQIAKGMTADGIVGEATWTILLDY